jgi:hypothetical protein
MDDTEIGRRRTRIVEAARTENLKRSEFTQLMGELQGIPLTSSENCLRRAILRNRLADLGTEIDAVRMKQIDDIAAIARLERST